MSENRCQEDESKPVTLVRKRKLIRFEGPTRVILRVVNLNLVKGEIRKARCNRLLVPLDQLVYDVKSLVACSRLQIMCQTVGHSPNPAANVEDIFRRSKAGDLEKIPKKLQGDRHEASANVL